MKRRTFGALGVSVCLAGCSGITGEETVVNETYRSPHQENIEVKAEQTLRVEVTPLDPEYQLIFFVGKAENVDDSSSIFGSLSGFERVNSEVAREITPSEKTEYIVVVGWFEDPKELDFDQYRLRVTVG